MYKLTEILKCLLLATIFVAFSSCLSSRDYLWFKPRELNYGVFTVEKPLTGGWYTESDFLTSKWGEYFVWEGKPAGLKEVIVSVRFGGYPRSFSDVDDMEEYIKKSYADNPEVEERDGIYQFESLTTRKGTVAGTKTTHEAVYYEAKYSMLVQGAKERNVLFQSGFLSFLSESRTKNKAFLRGNITQRGLESKIYFDLTPEMRHLLGSVRIIDQ